MLWFANVLWGLDSLTIWQRSESIEMIISEQSPELGKILSGICFFFFFCPSCLLKVWKISSYHKFLKSSQKWKKHPFTWQSKTKIDLVNMTGNLWGKLYSFFFRKIILVPTLTCQRKKKWYHGNMEEMGRKQMLIEGEIHFWINVQSVFSCNVSTTANLKPKECNQRQDQITSIIKKN